MAIRALDELNEIQIDVLREIGNIGSGNAATALSAMLMHPINIAVPKIRILDYNDVVEALGGPETMIVGLMLMMEDDVQGMLMFLLEQEFADVTLSALMGEGYGSVAEMDEMCQSAIQEIGNIMAGSYVNAISEMADLQINISVPSVCVDMAGAILSVPAIHYANIGDKVIFIEDEFNRNGQDSSSHVLMIPDVDSLKKIMTNLGIEV